MALRLRRRWAMIIAHRYYLALTKRFDFKNIGLLGVHAGYVYNKRIDYHLNGPAMGVDFKLKLGLL